MAATPTEKGIPAVSPEGPGGLRLRIRRGGEARRMAGGGSPTTAGLWILALGMSSLLPLAVAWPAKAIVDAAVAKRTSEALGWVLVELLMMASLGAVQRGASVLRALLGTRLGISVNLRILRKALTLELWHFQDSELYDQLTRARRE